MLKREEYQLRPIVESDLDLVLSWRNSDRVRAYMYTDHIISESEHRAWFDRIKHAELPNFMIFEDKFGPVGVTSFTELDKYHNRCTWGFYLGKTEPGKGTGSVMGFLALEYIFEQCQLHKLCAEAFAFNIASIKYHQKLGFVQEGLLRQHVLKNNAFQDVMVFGYIQNEWLTMKAKLESLLFEEG